MASKLQPCPWSKAEGSRSGPRLRAPRRDHVGVVGPRHRAGREQEEAAAHAGGAHAGESRRPGTAGGPGPQTRARFSPAGGALTRAAIAEVTASGRKVTRGRRRGGRRVSRGSQEAGLGSSPRETRNLLHPGS